MLKRIILKLFGAKVGKQSRLESTVNIRYPWNVVIGDFVAIGEFVEIYSLGKVTIKDRSTVSQHCYICAGSHDLKTESRKLLKPSIIIDEDAWVAAKAFIGPNVRISKGAVVGAASVVFKDIPPRAVVVGNPAKIVRYLND